MPGLPLADLLAPSKGCACSMASCTSLMPPRQVQFLLCSAVYTFRSSADTPISTQSPTLHSCSTACPCSKVEIHWPRNSWAAGVKARSENR